jgi:hypothetical protein
VDREETILREDIATCMRGYWLMSWHEDREVNPGVPDISYTFNDGKHETGWLELKAIAKPVNGRHKFILQPSQHRWIATHWEHIPIHFLLAIPDRFWLVPGQYHYMLTRAVNIDDLNSIGSNHVRQNMRSALLTTLKAETHRSRRKW